MGLQVITIDEAEKWDNIINSFNEHDVFYFSGYVKAFHKHGDGEPLLFYYEDENTRAINVVMKRDIENDEKFSGRIPANTYFDLSTPYGYGGFIIEGDNYEQVNKEYEEYCCRNKIVCEFVRFNLFSKYEKKYKGEIEARTHNIIRSLNIEPEQMLMDFEHKVRKNLKKANRNDLKIEIDTTGKSLNEFLDIYYSTMNRNNAKECFYFKKEFFQMLNAMKNNIAYFNVVFKGKVISTELVVYSKNNCYSYLGGTLNEFFDLRPNEFLKYEIIKWAHNKGIKNFVLGGGYGMDDGIYKYKKSFAPNGIVEFFIGKKIFDDKLYSLLLEIRNEEQGFKVNTEFFPAYRG